MRLLKVGLLLAGMLAVTTSPALAVDDKAYTIRFARPSIEGSVRQFTSTVVTDSHLAAHDPDGRVVNDGDLEHGAQLIGSATVLQVNDGLPSRVALDVQKLIGFDGSTERPLLPPGTRVIATEQDQRTSFSTDGHPASAELQSALASVARLGNPRVEAAYGDAALGTNQPKHIGDAWPVNADVVAKAMSGTTATIRASDVHGTVTLTGTEPLGGIDCLAITVDITLRADRSVSAATQPSGGYVWDAWTRHNLIKYDLPIDPTVRASRITDSVEIQYTGRYLSHGRVFGAEGLVRRETYSAVSP